MIKFARKSVRDIKYETNFYYFAAFKDAFTQFVMNMFKTLHLILSLTSSFNLGKINKLSSQ